MRNACGWAHLCVCVCVSVRVCVCQEDRSHFSGISRIQSLDWSPALPTQLILHLPSCNNTVGSHQGNCTRWGTNSVTHLTPAQDNYSLFLCALKHYPSMAVVLLKNAVLSLVICLRVALSDPLLPRWLCSLLTFWSSIPTILYPTFIFPLSCLPSVFPPLRIPRARVCLFSSRSFLSLLSIAFLTFCVLFLTKKEPFRQFMHNKSKCASSVWQLAAQRER